MRDRRTLLAGLLFLLAVGAMLPVVGNGFISFDDQEYVTENRHVLGGLSWQGLVWAATSFQGANWHPLTWLSHMLDVQLYGTRPWGHHLTSLLLHGVNTLLLFLCLDAIGGGALRSAAVAALFAVHPLHVEPVAWAAQRKELLAALFFFLALGAYVRYTKTPERRPFWPVPLLLAAGLTAKPTLIIFPLLLLALDATLLPRNGEGTGARRRGLMVEKLPLFLLALLSGAVTLVAQRGAIPARAEFPVFEQASGIVVALGAYLAKALLPAGLSVFYRFPVGGWPVAVTLASAASLALLTWLLLFRTRNPWLKAGWLWFLIANLPTVGIVKVGAQAYADRYTYLPLIGLAMIAVHAAADMTSGRRRPAWAAPALLIVILACLAPLSWRRAAEWRSGVSLFSSAVRVDPGNYMARANLGSALVLAGETAAGEAELRTSLALNPEVQFAHYDLAVLLHKRGELTGAERHYREAVRIDAKDDRALHNLGLLLAETGRGAEGEQLLLRAIGLDPEAPIPYNSLGIVYENRGETGRAAEMFRQALSRDPGYREAQGNLRRVEGAGRR